MWTSLCWACCELVRVRLVLAWCGLASDGLMWDCWANLCLASPLLGWCGLGVNFLRAIPCPPLFIYLYLTRQVS